MLALRKLLVASLRTLPSQSLPALSQASASGGLLSARELLQPWLSLAACGRGASHASSPRSFSCLAGRPRAAACLPAASLVHAAPSFHTAARGGERGVSVDVDNNQVDKAMRKLKRKLIEEGIAKELKERTHFVKPSQQRVRCDQPAKLCWCAADLLLQVLMAKAREKRVRKRSIKVKLNWILRCA